MAQLRDALGALAFIALMFLAMSNFKDHGEKLGGNVFYGNGITLAPTTAQPTAKPTTAKPTHQPTTAKPTTDPPTMASLTTAPPTSTGNKCAILFFGLARKFKEVSLPSIEKYIVNVNPGCDIYAHTYDIASTTNTRNNEINQPIHAHEVELISSRLKLVMDTNESFEKVRDLTYFRNYFPPDKRWSWVYPTSMDNMIKQWHSIDAVWNAMPNGGEQYDRIGLFRLDMLYIEPISVTANPVPALVPGWASGPGGMNDRMFVGDYKYAKVWATGRFSLFADHAVRHENHVHSETFMNDLMTTNHVPITKTNICFKRVRATGEIKHWDCPGKH